MAGGFAAGESFEHYAKAEMLSDFARGHLGDEGADIGDAADEAGVFQLDERFPDGGLADALGACHADFGDGVAGAQFSREDRLADSGEELVLNGVFLGCEEPACHCIVDLSFLHRLDSA